MTELTTDIQSTIQAIAEDFESTFESGDTSKLAEFYTDNGMLLPAGSDFAKGREAIKEYWQVAIDMGLKIKLNILEIEQQGDSAIEMSKYTLIGRDNQVIDSGKGIVIWKYSDEAWKMHRDIWNSNLG